MFSYGSGNVAVYERIEVWVENLSANRNVTAEIGGLVGITER